MSQSVTTKATSREIEPTIQWRVQKHAPEKMKITVAAMGSDLISDEYCTVYCMENVK